VALIAGLSSGETGCKQLVGIHETRLGDQVDDGGLLDQGSGPVDTAADGAGGTTSTSAGGSGGASSPSGGNSGSGAASGTGGAGAATASGGSGTGGRPAGSGGTGGLGMGGAQGGGTATGGAATGGAGGTGGAPAKKANGGACRMNADCVSDMCGAEGVCCNSICNGQCESCVTALSLGTCVAVGTPRTPCAGSGPCRGYCAGGNRSACTYPTSNTICADPSCMNGSARGASTCDGQGACVTPAAMTCEGGCNGSACVATCQHPSSSNLLSNPGFDGSISPWGPSGTYSSNDLDGCSTSGSCALDEGRSISQCLPATPGLTYWMRFRFKGWDNTQTYSGWCSVDFYPSTNPDCSGTSTLGSGLAATAASEGGAWSAPTGAGGPAPAGTAKMSFSCSGSKGRGFYDQLFVGTSIQANF